jgi:hypothetical protein
MRITDRSREICILFNSLFLFTYLCSKKIHDYFEHCILLIYMMIRMEPQLPKHAHNPNRPIVENA